jgi:hypoxanthine phosphoribosyltransferase
MTWRWAVWHGSHYTLESPPIRVTPAVLLGADEVHARVRALALAIRHDAGAELPLHFVGVLKGAFVFLADLLRAMDGPVTCDFLAVSSYGAGDTSSGEVQLTRDLDQPIDGRDVVLVEDIVDTGHTLRYLQQLLGTRQPRTLRTVCLLDKPARRQVEVRVDYTGFTIEDQFVVGYGLDLDEQYRNLPYIGVMTP